MWLSPLLTLKAEALMQRTKSTSNHLNLSYVYHHYPKHSKKVSDPSPKALIYYEIESFTRNILNLLTHRYNT